MIKSSAAAWIVAAALAAVDAIWAHAVGIRIVGVVSVAGWITVAFISAIACRLIKRVAFRLEFRLVVEGARRSTAMFDCVAVLIALGNACATLSYLVISTRMPLVDEQLAGIDALLGFDWVYWFDFVKSHRWLRVTLFYAYDSTLPAMGMTLIYLTLAGRVWRYHEMLWIFILTAVATAAICGFLPAMAAPAYYFSANHRTFPYNLYSYLPDLSALRDGTLSEINLTNLQGIVCFPSFHTVLFIIYCYALRETRLVWPALVLGGLTMLSVPTIGGHYLIDIPGGAVVAVAAILAVRRWWPERIPIDVTPAANIVARGIG
jgi:hypothetical protein